MTILLFFSNGEIAFFSEINKSKMGYHFWIAHSFYSHVSSAVLKQGHSFTRSDGSIMPL